MFKDAFRQTRAIDEWTFFRIEEKIAQMNKTAGHPRTNRYQIEHKQIARLMQQIIFASTKFSVAYTIDFAIVCSSSIGFVNSRNFFLTVQSYIYVT